jgi:hypothetical protein
MGIGVHMSTGIMILYYAMTAFFALCLIVNFARTKDPQKAILYLVILMPFVMRLARLK